MNSNNMCQENEQESQQIEWKWSWQDEFLKWLCGYANADGGTLYIGVNDDGYVVGVEDSKRMLEGLPNKINDKLGIVARRHTGLKMYVMDIQYLKMFRARLSTNMHVV